MDSVLIFNVVVGVFSILFCLFGVLMLFVGTKLEAQTRHYFNWIFCCNALSNLSNLFGLIYRGNTGTFARIIIPIANFSEYFFGYALSFVFTMYLFYSLGLRINRKMLPLFLLYGLSVVLLIVSQFNGMYYFHDAQNRYQRGDWFWLSQLFGILFMVIDLLMLIRYRNRLRKKELYAMAIYILLPAVALVVQLFVYGIYLLLLTTSITIMVVFVLIMMAQVERYCEKERQITDLQTEILLSQIQPHFLFNALTAIYCLCDSKPEQAKEAISEFSKYLRGNLDSIKQSEPISFRSELGHIRAYLTLEKIRFGEELEVVYDIRTENFFLPALTVQPLVENAVNHGIGHLPGGGCVTLSTEESDSCYEIRVTDNGVGFVPGAVPQDERSHVGIKNVRSRLEVMCHGSLRIESEPGRGTTAIVRIPKDGGIS